MANSLVRLPLPYVGDFNKGRPLFNAQIFIGEPDLDPEIPVNQKTVTGRQEDGTLVTMSQPVRTSSGGYPVYNNAPIELLVDGAYSLKVLDKNDNQNYYFANVEDGRPVTFDDDPVLFDDKPVLYRDTVAEAKADVDLTIGMYVVTKGYNSPNGGGANYIVVAGGTGTDDGILFIDKTDGSGLQLERLPMPTQVFDTATDMIAAPWLGVGDTARTVERTSSTTNGGAFYTISDTGVDDGGAVLDLLNGNKAILGKASSLDAAVYGLEYGGNADNAAMANFISYCEANNVEAVISGDLSDLLEISISGDLNLNINGVLTHRAGVNQTLISSTEIERGTGTIAANVQVGENVISVLSSSFPGIEVGDIAIIHSTEIFDPRTSTYYGDASTVKAFTGATVTLDTGANFEFLTANNAKLTVYKPHRINIYGKYTIKGDQVSDQTAIELKYCLDSKISGGRAEDNNLVGFRFDDSLSCHIENCHSYRCQKATLGYGFSIKGASKSCTITNSAATDCRHIFTTNNAPSPARGNIVQDITVRDCYGYGTALVGDGFDTHAASINIDFINCAMYDAKGIGFNHESAGGSIVNCRAYRSGAEGIRVRNETYYPGIFRMTGNRVFTTGSTGIKVGSAITSTTLFADFYANDNRTYDAAGSGIWFAVNLAEAVHVGVNTSTGFGGSKETVYDSANIIITSMSTGVQDSQTIASDTINANAALISVTPEGGVGGTDDLSTINGGVAGQIITLRSSANSNTITLKDIVGNLSLAGDFILTSSTDRIMLISDGSNWYELSRSDNS